MGVRTTFIAAYGVILEIGNDDACDAAEEAGFEFTYANYYERDGEVFIFIPETRIDLESGQGLKEVVEPISEHEAPLETGNVGNEENNEAASCNEKKRKRKGPRIGAVLEIPCPSKEDCDKLITLLKEHVGKEFAVEPFLFSSIG
jgi:hypothetical protein